MEKSSPNKEPSTSSRELIKLLEEQANGLGVTLKGELKTVFQKIKEENAESLEISDSCQNPENFDRSSSEGDSAIQ